MNHYLCLSLLLPLTLLVVLLLPPHLVVMVSLVSGCTQHMTDDARMFNSINTNGNDGYDSITFVDNGKGKVKGLGKIAISNNLSISNVLLVESLNFNLLSVAQLCDLIFKCIFGVDDIEIISVDGSNLIFKEL